MNNNLFLESPVEHQKFIWIATYDDGSFFPEYTFDNKSENLFHDIDKDKIIRFGLIGYKMNMYFEVYGGVFKIAGRMIEVFYRDKDTNKEYYLTGQPLIKYNDLIQFKDAYSFFDPSSGGGELKPNITQHNIGYKQNLNIDGVQFYFKAICCVPYGENVYLNLRLVADRNFENGAIVIKRNGEEEFEYDAPMIANESYEINWEVK